MPVLNAPPLARALHGPTSSSSRKSHLPLDQVIAKVGHWVLQARPRRRGASALSQGLEVPQDLQVPPEAQLTRQAPTNSPNADAGDIDAGRTGTGQDDCASTPPATPSSSRPRDPRASSPPCCLQDVGLIAGIAWGLGTPGQMKVLGPMLIMMILSMMVLPLAPSRSGSAVHLQHRTVDDDPDGQHVRHKLLGSLGISRRARRSRPCCGSRSTWPRHASCCLRDTTAETPPAGHRSLQIVPGSAATLPWGWWCSESRRSSTSWSSPRARGVSPRSARASRWMRCPASRWRSMPPISNAGLIGEDQARERRREVAEESATASGLDGRREQVRAR